MTGKEKTLKFIKRYGSDIIPALVDTNIFIETAVAQKCLESGFGTSNLAKNYNNFGGIKGRATYSSGVTSNGWAIFRTPNDSFRSYAYFVTSKRRTSGELWYKRALEAKTPEDQIYYMVVSGYCAYTNMTPEQGARYYLSKCKGFITALQEKNIGGKVGSGGRTSSSLISQLTTI